MRIGELAKRSGVTVKAVRYYESLGLIRPDRLSNGYRDYREEDMRAVIEVRELAVAGITARQAIPFLNCLSLGHEHGDDCASSLVAYRDAISEIDRGIESLRAKRYELVQRLDQSASRTFTKESTMADLNTLPEGLPIPVDDGAADHLPGVSMPALTLRASDGDRGDRGELGAGRTVVYLYPLSGRPGAVLPDGWESIPGARGCTSEACDFRDHFDDLRSAGVSAVYGLSSQNVGYQAEVTERLRLPFAMLSDERFQVADVLDLPTFDVPGQGRLYSRLTLIVSAGQIEHAFYPIFPPNAHAQQVLAWLHEHP